MLTSINLYFDVTVHQMSICLYLQNLTNLILSTMITCLTPGYSCNVSILFHKNKRHADIRIAAIYSVQ